MTNDGGFPKEARLIGKVNYCEWRRNFDRVAKMKDLWKVLSGETMLNEPTRDSCLIYTDGSSAAAETNAQGGGENGNSNGNSANTATPNPFNKTIDGSLSFLNFQIATTKWEKQQKTLQQIRTLLFDSVTESIQIELEDRGFSDHPVKGAAYICKVYGVSNERIREELLKKVNSLTLNDCASITDLINKHKVWKLDLGRAKMTTYTTATMVTNILNGLPDTYASIKEKWDWDRASHPDDEPDIQFLQDRLLVKEEELAKEKKRVSGRGGRGGSRGGGTSRGGRSTDNPNSDKVCDWEACGRVGHVSADCWIKHPDKKPQYVKDREAKRAEEWKKKKAEEKKDDKDKTGKPPKVMAASIIDVDGFRDELLRAKKTQQTNPFAILDTPLGEQYTASGMSHDLSDQDIGEKQSAKESAPFVHSSSRKQVDTPTKDEEPWSMVSHTTEQRKSTTAHMSSEGPDPPSPNQNAWIDGDLHLPKEDINAPFAFHAAPAGFASRFE